MNYGKYLFTARAARSMDMRQPYAQWVAKFISVSFGLFCMAIILWVLAFATAFGLWCAGWVS